MESGRPNRIQDGVATVQMARHQVAFLIAE